MTNATEPPEVSERSFEPIDLGHLRRLARLALADLESLFSRRPATGDLYRDRLLALCLCQGAAEHFVRGRHGVKDLDVWAFFSEHPARPFPARRRGRQDFGPSSLGRHPADRGYTGRRVDVLGRSIPCRPDELPEECIRRWLHEGRTESAGLVSQRPVVGLYPAALFGRILWDPGS